jgi:hypothetical protein
MAAKDPGDLARARGYDTFSAQMRYTILGLRLCGFGPLGETFLPSAMLKAMP